MTGSRITVHLILHAHIDPVWLWSWQAGLDETIATCRSACDRLDTHHDAIFTLGDAWGYRMIERTDPRLFRRIEKHVESGQWEIVGGWWLQPDCNLPSGVGFEKQIELGRRFFLDRFGVFPRVAFNVDSFGHAASLPSIMRAFGQDRYVMMRPSDHEMTLPGRIFHWRGFHDDAPVTCFRIGGRYWTNEVTTDHILAATSHLPSGVRHTMCFIGLGDHGGGPTERQIAWCREHANAIPDCELVFSSPSRFFDAIEKAADILPAVTGELQHHAIGCYSVTRSVKTAIRKAEHLLVQAENMARNNGGLDARAAEHLNDGWERVCFGQFHDALGGTCLPSSYPQIEDGAAYARAVADEFLQLGLRRQLADSPYDSRQRIALFNASDFPFKGFAVVTPWIEGPWRDSWRVVTSEGDVLPHQLLGIEGSTPPSYMSPQILFRLFVSPTEFTTLFIERDDEPTGLLADVGAAVQATSNQLRTDGVCLSLVPRPSLTLDDAPLIQPQIELYTDPTDTWAHGALRLGTKLSATARWEKPLRTDSGPLMASLLARGRIADSDLTAEWRVYAGEPGAELLLRVHWRAIQHVLKLVVPLFEHPLCRHYDGIPGRILERRPESIERPIRDFTLLEFQNGGSFGVVCPDVFSMEASTDALELTLLRSPIMAHHDPAAADESPRAIPSDQGVHEFRFFFASGPDVDANWLEERAMMYHRPLITADWTSGMAARSER